MGIFERFRREPLKILSDYEQDFLINYFGDRLLNWGVDTAVKERFPDVEQYISLLMDAGFFSIQNGKYILSERGQARRIAFRKRERERREKMHESVVRSVMNGNYLEGYNFRADYERNSIIPHGIFTGCNPWKEKHKIPRNLENYLECAHKLDFSDCNNSENFKNDLRKFYVAIAITGSNRLELPKDFESKHNEYLDCPNLERQLKEKCLFRDPPKLRIYFNTKVAIFNLMSTGVIKFWDGNFNLGMYDCTVPVHAAIAEYKEMCAFHVVGIPKTFQTFFKHKQNNTVKYQNWTKDAICKGMRYPNKTNK